MNRMFVKCNMPYKYEKKQTEIKEDGTFLFDIIEEIIIARRKTINQKIVKELFEIYKDSKYSEVYIISETEFERFLKWALPKYFAEKGEE